MWLHVDEWPRSKYNVPCAGREVEACEPIGSVSDLNPEALL